MEKNRIDSDNVSRATVVIGIATSIAIIMSDLSNWWLLIVPLISVFATVTALAITDWIVPKGAGSDYED